MNAKFIWHCTRSLRTLGTLKSLKSLTPWRGLFRLNFAMRVFLLLARHNLQAVSARAASVGSHLGKSPAQAGDLGGG